MECSARRNLTGLWQHTSDEHADKLLNDAMLSKLFKTAQQGAATTVWAAIAKSLEGRGGNYLEDCQISKPFNSTDGQWAPGYSTWAYDSGEEAKLWKKSLELVGLEDDA